MEETIESDVVYDHEKQGDVLVVSVGQLYDEYPLDEDKRTGLEATSELVFYYKQYDGWGGMSPSPLTENVHEFAKHTERKHTFEYDDLGLQEE